jgi:hypothetical protein
MHVHLGNMSILESLKILIAQSKDINQRADNPMVKRKRTKRPIIVDKALHKKRKVEKHYPY